MRKLVSLILLLFPLFSAANPFILQGKLGSTPLIMFHMIANPSFYENGIQAQMFATNDSRGCAGDLPMIGSATGGLNWQTENVPENAEDLADAGTNFTCVQWSWTFPSGHVYTTGKISLQWDDVLKTYTKATPSEVTIDVSNR